MCCSRFRPPTSVSTRAPRRHRLQRAPAESGKQHRQRQHAASHRAARVDRQISVLQPLPRQHGERGRRGRADDQRHVHHGEPVGQHRQQRPEQARRQLRPDHAPPGALRCVAQRLRQRVLGAPALAHVVALQLGGGGPEQEGDFLQGERHDQAQAPSVLGGGPGRWPVKAGEPGRERAQDPAAGRNQKHQADGKGRVRRGQHHRQAAQQHAQALAHKALRQQPRGEPPGQRGGGQAGPQRQAQRGQPLRIAGQRHPCRRIEQRPYRLDSHSQQRQADEQQQSDRSRPAQTGHRVRFSEGMADAKCPQPRAPPNRLCRSASVPCRPRLRQSCSLFVPPKPAQAGLEPRSSAP
jgi:hypothetical protein